MADNKVVTISGASKLAKAGVFAPGEYIGITKHGHAIYHHGGGIIVVRPAGPRDDWQQPLPAAPREMI